MYKAIVIGTSIGGIKAMSVILSDLPADFPVPIIMVQHISDDRKSDLADYFNKKHEIQVVEAQEKHKILPACVYIAPPGYHLLIEDDYTFALDNGEFINYARPSVDALFQSAAYVYEEQLIALILTGSNHDGGEGMKAVKENGGYTIVQDVQSSESSDMIEYAIKLTKIDAVVELKNIVNFLKKLVLT